jgi:antitoxin component YwqK of YwqJK toxin-antitoxin module
MANTMSSFNNNTQMIGVVRSYHDLAESKLKEEYFVNAGVREGVYRSYYEDGQIWNEVNYINEELESEVDYCDGEADYWALESEDDNIDKREGVHKSYYNNGQLKSEVNYINGVREGVYRSYYENGQLWEEVNYINGVREGFYKSYYSNGQLWEQVNYINGEREGVFTSYNRNGELEIEADYWVLESEVDN